MYEVTLQAGDYHFGANSSWPEVKLGKIKPELLVLLLHGFPDTRATWNSIFPYLEARLGAKTLLVAPSLRGYESSTANFGDYSLRGVTQDVIEWIDTLSLGARTYIVGHDWGSLVGFYLASSHENKVEGIFTLAVPYMADVLMASWRFPEQLWRSSYIITMQFQMLYGRRLHDPEAKYLRSLWKAWSPGWKFTDNEINEVADALKQPEVANATTAYYRNLPLIPKNYGFVNFQKVRVYQLGGANDGCMSAKMYKYERQRYPDAVTLMEGVGHFMHRENPSEVTELIVQFLRA